MDREALTQPFEQNRAHLRSVAFRMLGSLSEAEDAVQEAWLRLERTDATRIENLKGWLTTVVARVCLDMLRSRKTRAEEHAPEEIAGRIAPTDPENEAALADSVGVALLVMLDLLDPAERLAFVLHDVFAMPFDEIAPIVGRSSEAARQLASRARRRIRGTPKIDEAEVQSQRKIVSAFLTALRAGDFDGLVAVLDPDVIVHADTPEGDTRVIRGAANWAKGAIAFAKALRLAEPALVDGNVGLVVALGGHRFRALRLTFANGKIVTADAIAKPERLAELELGVLNDA